MQRSIDALEQIIRNESALHAKLLAAAEAKRQAIIAGDVAVMESTLNDEYDLVEQVEAQEKTRLQLVEKMAGFLEIAARPVTMDMLLAKLPEANTETLRAARAELRDLLNKLRIRTRQNAELLKASMEHVNSFMELIAHAGEVRTYSRKGALQRQPGVSFIDRSA